MRELLSSYLAELRGMRARRTVSTYEEILGAFFDFADERGAALTPSQSDVEVFLARPRHDGEPRAPAARNQALAALRSFARWATRDGHWSSDPTTQIPFAKVPRTDPAFLTVFELRRLFGVARDTARPGLAVRDVAIVAVLSQAGLRVSELVSLDVDQVDAVGRTLASILGKGGTRRDVPLADETLRILRAWLRDRERLAGPDEQALLVHRDGRRMSVRAVQRLFMRWRAVMGTRKKLSPHAMRHSFVTVSLELGADVVVVSDLVAHADLRTTQLYVHLVDPRRRQAVERLAVAIPKDLLPEEPTAATASDASHPGPLDSAKQSGDPLDAQYGLGAGDRAA